jgi:hypothetical protein
MKQLYDLTKKEKKEISKKISFLIEQGIDEGQVEIENATVHFNLDVEIWEKEE